MKLVEKMSLCVVVAMLVLGCAPAAVADPNCPVQGMASVVAFEDVGYQGAALAVDGDVADLRALHFNDAISSIRARGTVVSVYEGVDYQGRCVTFDGSVRDLRDSPWSINDAISSIRVGQGCPDSSSERPASVVAFEDVGFGGAALRVDGDVPDLGAFDFNDRISSLKVRGTVSVYEDVDYLGRCRTLDASAEDLRASPWDFNDAISSIRIGQTCQ
jgi:hypothetical protein